MLWKKLDESCVSETNPKKLEKLVVQLEEAIVVRYHNLARESAGRNESAELQEIRRAAERLVRLKIGKLGWSRSSPVVPARPDSLDETRERMGLRTRWRKLACRIQAALLAAECAWQDWVFKSSK